MSRYVIDQASIECLQGDITRQPDMDAVVNAANAQLRPGGGVAGAIHHAAGPALDRECRGLAPIQPGQAVITDGHGLPNPWIIHVLGPVYGVDTPSDQLLADCYRNSLALAVSSRLKSVAFPAISTGAFGYPMEAATRVAVSATRAFMATPTSLEMVRFVVFSKADLAMYDRVLGDVVGPP